MIIRFEVYTQTLLPQSSLSKPKPTEKAEHNPKSTNKQTLNGLKSLQLTNPPPPTSNPGLRFREKLLYLQTLKVNPTKALQKNPHFRSTPLPSLKSGENCLSSMGIGRSTFGRIFDFLLNEVHIPFFDIRKSIVRCPRLLICSVEQQLRPTLGFLRKLGFVGPNGITSQTTLLLVSSVEETLLPKLDYLMSLGFEYEELVNMVLRSPGLLTFSIENNFKPKVEYFLREMNGDLAELRRFLQYFSFSLEGKIKRRHRLLVEHGLSLSLPEMLKVSNGEFNARLIEMRLRSL